MPTAPLENGYNARRARNQAADLIAGVDQRLTGLSKSRALNQDQLVEIFEMLLMVKDALRWLENAGAATMPREV